MRRISALSCACEVANLSRLPSRHSVVAAITPLSSQRTSPRRLHTVPQSSTSRSSSRPQAYPSRRRHSGADSCQQAHAFHTSRAAEARSRRTTTQTREKSGVQATEHAHAVSRTDAAYTPATTWDGLEIVGGEKDWDTGATYTPFKAAHTLETPEEISMAIFRATVEVYSTLIGGNTIPEFAPPPPGQLVNDTKLVKVSVSEGNPSHREVSLQFPSNEVAANVIAGLDSQTRDVPEGSKNYTPESLNQDLLLIGRTWLHAPLTNTDVKLAIVRRIMQLSGIHISDHIISKADTVSHLVYNLAVPPPPKKIAEELQMGPLSAISNVKIYHRRVTPIDKERQLGRWKVMEKALQEHGLPVVGRH